MFASCTGKEKLFIELAKTLGKKVYVTAAKLRLLECLSLPQEDMQWLTPNEHESHIHVVPMWTIASFKRLKHVSSQYMVILQIYLTFNLDYSTRLVMILCLQDTSTIPAQSATFFPMWMQIIVHM